MANNPWFVALPEALYDDISAAEFRKMHFGEWPLATMSEEQVRQNRHCPYGGGRHDCPCNGECGWRLAREADRGR